MDKKRLGILGSLFLFLIVLIYFLFRTGAGDKLKPVSGVPPVETQPLPKDMEKGKKVTLFFLSEEDSLLHPEEREIAVRASTAEEAQEVIDELIKGPRSEFISSLPPETKLRQLFVTKDGMAYVDFSK
jgi:spore germination protein GerM